VTPFTAIALLERIRDEALLNEAQKDEIGLAIDRVERHYFGALNGETVNLSEIVQGWVTRAG
jgi:hypothetical protein